MKLNNKQRSKVITLLPFDLLFLQLFFFNWTSKVKSIFKLVKWTIKKVARNLRLQCAFKCICWMHFAYTLIAHVRFLINSPLFWHKPHLSWGCQVARCLELLLIFHIQNGTISYKYTHILTLSQQPHQAFAITKTNHFWQFVSTCAKVFTLERVLFLNSVFLTEIKLSIA